MVRSIMTPNRRPTRHRPVTPEYRRRLRRAAWRHNRITMRDRMAFWQAARRSRGRYAGDWTPWVRLVLVLTITVLGVTACAVAV
jgi:hypothetical protein